MSIRERETKSDVKSKFMLTSIGLIADLKGDAVRDANSRAYEESFTNSWRRGFDPKIAPFNSADEAAVAYKLKVREKAASGRMRTRGRTDRFPQSIATFRDIPHKAISTCFPGNTPAQQPLS